MKLSVIIPVYNVENYLEQCLDSVLNQTYKNIEVICVDDCSTDNSYKILQKYAQKDSRVNIIKQNSHNGVGSARNAGIGSASRGGYIHFLDSDDYLENDAYEKLIHKLDICPQVDILFFNYRMYNNKTNKTTNIEFNNKDILEKILNPTRDIEAFDNWDRMCWLKFLRTDFLKENHIYFPNYVSLSDVEWSAETFVKAKSIYYTDIVCVNYRVAREGSLVQNSNKSIKSTYQSFINNKILYKNLPEKLKYRMLGADYFLLATGLPEAYTKKIINIFELYYMIHEVNKDRDCKKYIFDVFKPYHSIELQHIHLLLNFWKIILKVNFPYLFRFLLNIKQRFKNVF